MTHCWWSRYPGREGLRHLLRHCGPATFLANRVPVVFPMTSLNMRWLYLQYCRLAEWKEAVCWFHEFQTTHCDILSSPKLNIICIRVNILLPELLISSFFIKICTVIKTMGPNHYTPIKPSTGKNQPVWFIDTRHLCDTLNTITTESIHCNGVFS